MMLQSHAMWHCSLQPPVAAECSMNSANLHRIQAAVPSHTWLVATAVYSAGSVAPSSGWTVLLDEQVERIVFLYLLIV